MRHQPVKAKGPNEEIQLGVYEHYKGGRYRVIGLARHSETNERLVIYQALHRDFGLYARPFKMFTEQVLVHGQPQPRFAFIEPD